MYFSFFVEIGVQSAEKRSNKFRIERKMCWVWIEIESLKTGAGICYLFCFDRGTVSGITIIRPIALILPKLQMAQLPHYVPLIDGSIEQPAQETVKKLSCQSRVDRIPYLPAKKWESHPSKEKAGTPRYSMTKGLVTSWARTSAFQIHGPDFNLSDRYFGDPVRLLLDRA